MKLFSAIIFSICSISLSQIKIDYKLTEIDNTKKEITISVKLDKEQTLYADSLDLSIDNPNLKLSEYKLSEEPTKVYDADFQDYSQILKNNFKLIAEVENKTNLEQNSNLFLSYQLNSNNNNFQEKKFNIKFFEAPQDGQKPVVCQLKEESEIKKGISLSSAIEKLSDSIQGIVTKTESTSIRLIFVLLLGILMSLTPCIYPMIPITAGVLQAQGTKSFFSNLMLSLAYSCGMATTFAIFGLTAAFTGHLFGQILANPFFIFFLILILAYLGFSMLGFYDMYIPKIMQNDTNNVSKKGSLFSIFMFGAITGSVASPCISPGLALLLTIVATLGNKLLGFVMLFVFGIGLSVPLLIVGTFSSSLNVLPQSGAWMLEVKKIFGFMLFAMCFYFLNNIVPFYILTWVISISIFATGVYYLKSIEPYDSKLLKNVKNLIGFVCIALSMLSFFKSFNETFLKKPQIKDSIWQYDYNKAYDQAKMSNKKLLIDVGAEWCSICKAIDKLVFGNKDVQKTLEKFVIVKVDATNSCIEPYVSIQKKYQIKGVPTILLVDPKTDVIIKTWDGRLYSQDRKLFIKELESYI